MNANSPNYIFDGLWVPPFTRECCDPEMVEFSSNIGAYCYAIQQPVTVYNISKLPFVGCYRTAKRYCDLMVEAGALEYTETGAIAITEKGNETSDFFFKALFEMPSLVANAGAVFGALLGAAAGCNSQYRGSAAALQTPPYTSLGGLSALTKAALACS